MNLNLIFFGD